METNFGGISLDLERLKKQESDLEKANKELAAIVDLVKKQGDISRAHHYFGTPSEQVSHTFEMLRNRHEQIVGGAKAFNQDMLVYLRAIGLICAMAANAGTHAEKNARLRGMIEQIESAIETLRKQDMQFTDRHYWSAPDVWRSDYPVRAFMERAHRAEQKLEALEKEIAVLKGDSMPPPNADVSEEISF